MAGDEKELGTEIPDIEIEDPWERLERILAGREGDLVNIYSELASIGYEIWGPFVSAAALVTVPKPSQWPKLRVRHVIITADIATTITLNVGAGQYPFVFDPDSAPAIIPFPLVIERGIDVSFSALLAVTMACYVIGKPE